MKTVRYSTKAKKDLKKYRNDLAKMRELAKVLEFLVNGKRLPDVYRAHKLLGEYKDCIECHVGSDYLLIWKDETGEYIEIVRIGSHSELFHKY